MSFSPVLLRPLRRDPRRKISGVLLAALASAASVFSSAAHSQTPQAQVAQASPPLVIDGVTVIDVVRGARLPNQRVVVVGNRIRAISAAGQGQLPAGARVIQASGTYMIPGLWDMHVHLDTDAPELYPRFIAHGVTGVREMAQRHFSPLEVIDFSFAGADSFRAWQHEVMTGARVGPRGIGPSVDFPEQVHGTTAEMLRLIDSLKTAGYAFLKYHEDGGEREKFFAMLREARRVGLPMAGHQPLSVTSVEIADSGYASLEHVNEQHQCWPNFPVSLGDSAALDQRCKPAVQAYIRNQTWLDPTLSIFLAGISPYKPSAWVFKDALRLIRMMHQAGVTNFLAGTDWSPRSKTDGEPQFLPGLSAAEEIVFLGDAGLTPLQALQTGTLNPAKFLHATDSLGTVEVGKIADLVLLNADPLTNVQNVLNVHSVVANGRYFDRTTLDTLDPIGTKPGSGLIALDRRRQQQYSANFIADPDTTDILLTEALLARVIPVRKALRAFWDEHPALRDSLHEYIDFPIIGAGAGTEIFDYVTLVRTVPALAEIFAKGHVRPEDYWALHITLRKTIFQITQPSPTPLPAPRAHIVANNIALFKAHKAELNAVGLDF